MPDVLEQTAGADPGAAPDGVPGIAAPAAAARRGAHPALRLASDYGILVLTLLMLVGGALLVHGFGSSDNLTALMRDASFVGIVALGMTFVVMSGSYVDLSVAAQVGIAAVCAIALQPHGLVLALLAGLGACVAVGVVNGAIVGYVRANAVVVTLGIGTISLAVLNEITQGALYSGSNDGFANLMGTTIGPVPISFAVFLAVAAAATVLLDRMGYGRRIRAVGSSRAAAELAGVASGRVVLAAFAITSLCCWLAGVLLSGFVDSANPSLASDYTFEALAGVIVGGTSLTGGRGGAGRTVVGVLLIATIANLLIVAGLSFEWQQLIKGAVIVAAVAFDAVTRRLVAR